MDDKTLALFNKAFEVMGAEAAKRGITGAGAIAYLADANSIDWQVMAQVFGKLEIPPSEGKRGWNLVGFASAKLAECMRTKVQSGNSPDPTRNGEADNMGADIKPCGKGFVAAAFSGGPSEQDLEVSRATIDALCAELAS